MFHWRKPGPQEKYHLQSTYSMEQLPSFKSARIKLWREVTGQGSGAPGANEDGKEAQHNNWRKNWSEQHESAIV